MAITEDASTPAVVTGSSTGTATTASFSPPAYSLLLAMVAGGKSSTTLTAAVADTGSHTWTSGGSYSGATGDNGGVAAFYLTYLAAAPGSITVTATYTGFGTGGGRMLAVRVLNGANPDQSGAAVSNWYYTSPGGTNNALNIVPNFVNSFVYGIATSANTAATWTSSNCTILSSFASAEPTQLVTWKSITASADTVNNEFLGGNWSTTSFGLAAGVEIIPSIPPRPLRNVRQAVKRASFY